MEVFNPSEKSLQYPLDGRPDGLQSWLGWCEEEKHPLPLPGNKLQFLSCPAVD
jgi:hypothetical protein